MWHLWDRYSYERKQLPGAVAKVGQVDTTTTNPSTGGHHHAAARVAGRRAGVADPERRGPLRLDLPGAPGANFVDLHVYLGGAAAIDHPGTLYSYVYADQTPDFPLPFTYPPFAAVVFYPLHLLPFGLVAFGWQVATMVALYGAIRLSQRLLGAGRKDRTAMLWTAITIWIDPLRSTFDYGQINVLLMLAVLWAVDSTRWWLTGLLVGVAAGSS